MKSIKPEAKVGGGQVDLGKMKPTKDGWGIPTWEIVSRQFLKISYLSIVIKENDAYLIVTDYRAIKNSLVVKFMHQVFKLVIKIKAKR